MDLHELEYLTTIARFGNLTAASKELYVSQPTLTKFLQRTEQELGFPLFEHIGRRMIPTYAGERYLHHASVILEQKKKLDIEMNDIRNNDNGSLRVGMPHFRCTYSLEEILPSFSKQYPGVLFTLIEDNSASLDKKLLAGEADLAFFMNFKETAGLAYKVISHDKPYVIFAKGHRLEKTAKQSGVVHLKDLDKERIILQSSSQRLGQYVLRKFAENHITPSSVLENTNLRASCALAANGYGIAFAYGEMLKYMNLPDDYNSYPVAEFNLPADFVAAWRETTQLSPYAEYFIELVEKTSKF